MNSKKEEVLRQLKLVRKAKGMSYQDIVDGTEEMGIAVSLSSVKRVFSEDSKAADFRYDTTLRPIVRFVMGVDTGVDDLENFEQAKASAEGLVAVVDLKDTMINRLEAELERTRADHHAAIEKLEAAEARKIAHLKEEIQIARAERVLSDTRMARWRNAAILFLSLFIAALLVVIAYLLVDRNNPNWGIFWAENPVPLSLLAALVGVSLAVSIFAASKKK